MRVEYTIEGKHLPVTDQLEIDDEELEGLNPAEREAFIGQLVEEAVQNDVNWGWTEL